MLVASVVLMMVVSLLTQPPSREKVAQLHWTPALLRLPVAVAAQKRHWYQSIALWWALMVGAFGAIYYVLW